MEFPFREDNPDVPKKTPPLVRVRLAVEYRVHSRQMLCVGGSQIPFGWSFLSIAKVPMSWNPRDVWTVEVSTWPEDVPLLGIFGQLRMRHNVASTLPKGSSWQTQFCLPCFPGKASGSRVLRLQQT